MDLGLRPNKGTLNRFRLTILLIKGGTRVLQKAMVDMLLKFYLQDKKENVMQQVGSLIYQQQFELLYPSNGHAPRIDALPDILLSFIRIYVLSLPDDPGISTQSALRTSIVEHLCSEGFQMYLDSKKHELVHSKKLSRAQWEILYSKSSPVTVNSLDISLLTFILVNTFSYKPTSGRWSEMPPPEHVTIGDDILRLRLLRNKILHQSSAKINDQQFENIWSEVQEVLERRLGNCVEYNELKKQTLDPDKDSQYHDILESWRQEETELKEALSELSVEINRGFEETKKLMTEGTKLTRERTMRSDEIVEELELQPQNKTKQTDFMHKQITNWKKQDLVYCSTRAADKVLEKLQLKNVVTIVGGPGCGKSMMSKHMALEFERQGYMLHDLLRPEDLRELYSENTKHVFIFEDPIGENIVDFEILNVWKRMDDGMRNILQQDNIKVIITMRSTISNDEIVQVTETVLTAHVVNITQGNLKLNIEEKDVIFRSHCPELPQPKQSRRCMFDCFPLLCYVYKQSKDNDTDIFESPFKVLKKVFESIQDTDKYKFSALVLCAVMTGFHDDLLDRFMTDKSLSADREKMNIILDAMELQPRESYSKLKKALRSLCGTYIQNVNDTYQFRHAIFKDIILYLCGSMSPGFIFQYFPSLMFRERVRIGEKLPTDGNEEFLLILNNTEKTRKQLATRLQADLATYNFKDVFLSPYLKLPGIEARLTEYISRAGSTLHSFDSNSMTILHWAASANFLVKCVVETGIKVDIRDVKGFSPLHYATRIDIKDFEEMITKFDIFDIDFRIYMDILTEESFTLTDTKVETVKLIIDKGADVNARNEIGISVLEFAILSCTIVRASINSMEIIKLLIEKGADVNTTTNGRLTPIILAIKIHNNDLVNMLIENGADVNIQTKNGVTAVIEAAKRNQLKNVKTLIENGAHVNLQDKDGETAVVKAAEKTNLEMVKFLIECGADINAQTEERATAILVAAGQDAIDIVKYMIENGADVNVQTKKGKTAVMKAARNNNVEMVKLLVENGADINLQTDIGNTAVMEAAKKNHIEMIKVLVENGADVNIPALGGKTAVIEAAIDNDTEIVQLLLGIGASVNVQTENGMSAIIFAANHNNMEMVKILLENGAYANVQSDYGMTALHFAALHYNIDMFAMLKKNGADANVQTKDGKTAISLAAENNDIELVKILIVFGADVNIQSKNGMTAFIHAAHYKNMEMAKILLANGADVNAQTEDGLTAVIQAAENNDLEMIKILLEKGANVNAQTKDGVTAIIQAADNNNIDIVKILLDNDADVNVRSNDGRTAFFLAALYYNFEMIIMLLEKGADVNFQTKDGMTALLLAVYYNYLEMFETLIENGADVNVQTVDGMTAVVHAAENNNIQMVRTLIEKGANVNVQTEDGMTAVVHAAENNNIEMVKILIEKGANVNVKTKDWMTAVIHAAENNNIEMVKALIEKGADVNVQTEDGMTSINRAVENDNFQMVYTLLENGTDVNVQTRSGIKAVVKAVENNNKEILQVLIEHILYRRAMQ